MFDSTIVFSALMTLTTMGLVVVYLTRLLALSALEIIDTQNLQEKYREQYTYISSINDRLPRLYPLYIGTILLNGGLLALFVPGSDSSLLISVLAAAVNASTIVNMYNINLEYKQFRKTLDEVGMIVDESDDE